VLSILIALIPMKRTGWEAAHILFVLTAGVIGLVVGLERPNLRVNASVVFVFFLFEPIGRVLLGHEAAPKNVVVALALALAGAYFFRDKGNSGDARQPK
jgi:hypothetical protein